jgi:hypothetical protein
LIIKIKIKYKKNENILDPVAHVDQMINLISLRQENNYKLENYTGNNMSPTVRLSPEKSLNLHDAPKTYIQTKTSSNAPYYNANTFKNQLKKIKRSKLT